MINITGHRAGTVTSLCAYVHAPVASLYCTMLAGKGHIHMLLR